MIELVHIPYSPWSEKARWALDVARLGYRSRYYAPVVDEPALRWRLRKLRGNVSAPVLFVDGRAIADSFDIARYAAMNGDHSLIPSGSESDVAAWNALSEVALASGRALSLERVLKEPSALRELVPTALRGKLGKVGVKLAALGVRRTMRKYRAQGMTSAEHLATLVDALERLRAGLAGRATLLASGFSYADITMAQVLAFVQPPDRGLKLGAGNRQAYAEPGLADRFPDLVAWRDALYARHRGESQAIRG